ncbi:MAG: hypothetical protein LBE48_01615, partial [Methanomassiliicoccaceae archaeon]|nr:hypothetical protein [Methanomassiliicoccaceae archaeon]
MRGNVRIFISSIVVSILLAVPFALMLADIQGGAEDDTDATMWENGFLADPKGTEFDDSWIPVSTPQELAWVGDGESHKAVNGLTYIWSLSAKYYLTNDIIFDPDNPDHNMNGGVNIQLSVVVSGTTLNITLTPSSSTIKELSARIEHTVMVSASNSVQLANIPLGTHSLSIKGTLTSGEKFLYSTIIDTTSNGTLTKTFDSNGNFNPIGTFTGMFNGDGNVISGVNLIKSEFLPSVVYAGLFVSASSDALISNVGLVGGSLTVASDSQISAGGIVGDADSSTITNCYNTGPVTSVSFHLESMQSYLGGIAGSTSSSSAITNCYNTGSISTGAISNKVLSNVGGIAGYASSTITNCYNTGSLRSFGNAGGIAGYASSTITNCYNTGSVSFIAMQSGIKGGMYAGGIVGQASSELSIINCYNTGSISSTAGGTPDLSIMHAGGIAGSASSITNCYNTGSVRSSSGNAGGIAGNASSTITNCYNTGSVSVRVGMRAPEELYAGGIAGNASSTITNCYNTGSVSLTAEGAGPEIPIQYIGGIAGNASSITNCYNTSSISMTLQGGPELLPSYAGGIAGSVSSITNCYNTGSISMTLQGGPEPLPLYVGGIAGKASSTITNCYYLMGKLSLDGSPSGDRLYGVGSPTVDGNSNGSPRPGIQGSGAKSEEDMKLSPPDSNSVYYTGITAVGSESVQGWDFNNTWTIISGMNNGYPIFGSFVGMTVEFTEQPQDHRVTPGKIVVFSAFAEVKPTMLPQYQWYISTDDGDTWQSIEGAVGWNYAFGPVSEEDTGTKFRVYATGPEYDLTTEYSDVATLYVGSYYNVTLTPGTGYTLSPHGDSE